VKEGVAEPMTELDGGRREEKAAYFGRRLPPLGARFIWWWVATANGEIRPVVN
jgi:hypothetical protein